MNIAGLDLSLTSTGCACAPLDWDGDWAKVDTQVVPFKIAARATDTDRLMRIVHIATMVESFCRFNRVRYAWIESPAYRGGNQLHAQGELAGIVKDRLWQLGVEPRVANQSSLRKLLLGKVPRRSEEVKAAVEGALVASGAPKGLTSDEYDAIAVLNWGMSEQGGYTFAQNG